MRTLYVSDLDGTLLRRDQTISPFTAETLNRLIGEGMLFSYATARSIVTAAKVTKEIRQNIPVIVYNGTFVVESVSGKRLISNFFTPHDAGSILEFLLSGGVCPFVYAFIDGVERYSFVEANMTEGMRRFYATRRDSRERSVSLSQIGEGDVFHFSCIDRKEKLVPLYERLKDVFPCVCYREMYSGDWWLEIMPPGVSKAAAVLQLKDFLGCGRVVSFGDGENDIPMFRVSDACYAVDNAQESLKKIASGVIGNHEQDGVAHWLRAHAETNGIE